MIDLTAIQTSPNKGSLLFISEIFEVDIAMSDKIKSLGGREQEALLRIAFIYCIVKEISILYCIAKISKVPIPTFHLG